MVAILKLLFLTVLTISASYAQTSKCAEKFNESSFKINNVKAWAVSANTALLYSPKKIKSSFIKHDPFLGLYLVKTPKKMKYTFDIVPRRPVNLRFMSKIGEGSGKITAKQIGLNSLAHFSNKGSESALITASCCQVNGIMTRPSRIIERDYIERFLLTKDSSYGSVGIRIKDGKKYPIVEASNPFFPKNPFKENDKIVKMNGKLVKSAASLMQKILFQGSNKKYEFEVIRLGESFILNVESKKREGGGLLSDSFLEPLGIVLDKNLKISSIKKGSLVAKLGIHLGDKLIRIGKHKINLPSQIRSAFSAEQSLKSKKISILFERKDFQFFIQVPKNI